MFITQTQIVLIKTEIQNILHILYIYVYIKMSHNQLLYALRYLSQPTALRFEISS